MKQIVWIINCYLYGATVILLVVLALLVYLRGQANHLPNPFVRRNIVYRPKEKAQGVLLGKKFGQLAYSPEQDEGHILVMGPSGTGKTSALLIPTLRSWQGTALVVDISGDISANVHTENKIILTLRQRIVFRMMCLRPLMQPRMIPSVRSVWSSWPICFCRTRPTTARRAYFHQERAQDDNGSPYLLLWNGLGLHRNLRIFPRP